MNEQSGLAKSVTFSIAAYPLYLGRTLIQLGYEPKGPDPNGRLPNLFSYLSIIRERRGYLSLYTGFRHHLTAIVIKRTSYDLMACVTNHKKRSNDCDASEIIALCLKESALKVQTTILTYPLFTLGVACISKTFFGADETIEYTVENLYKGLMPKLIVEVIMVWVSIISERIVVGLVKDELAQAIIVRVPPYLAQAFLYPFNVVSTVMADNGRSGLNPRFDSWKDCYNVLSDGSQLRRGSSVFSRRYHPWTATKTFNRFDNLPRVLPAIE